MEKILDFYCPRCRQKAEYCCASMIKYSFYRLDLPWYVCINCPKRKAGYSKAQIRGLVSKWRKMEPSTMRYPFMYLYREVIEKMEDIMKWRREDLGDEIVQFVGRPRR